MNVHPMFTHAEIIDFVLEELAEMAHAKFYRPVCVKVERWHDPHSKPWSVWSEKQNQHFYFETLEEVVKFLRPVERNEILFRKFK